MNSFILSPQQQRLWLLMQEGNIYQRNFAYVTLNEKVDRRRLELAVRSVFQQHLMLQVQYRSQHDQSFPEQIVCGVENCFTCFDDMPAVSRDTIHELLNQDSRPDNAHVYLIQHGDGTSSVLVYIPVLSADIVSYALVMTQIFSYYAQPLHGEQPSTIVPFQYDQYVEWINDTLLDGATIVNRNCVMDARNGFHQLQLPGQKVADSREEVEIVGMMMPESLIADLYAFAAQHNTTIRVVLLAAWNSLTGLLSSQQTVVTGLMDDGRDFEVLQGSVGIYSKVIPFTMQVEDQSTFTGLVAAAAIELTRLAEDKEYFMLGVSTEHPLQSRPGIYIPFLFEWLSRGTLPGSSGKLVVECHVDNFDLKLHLSDGPEGIACSLYFNPAVFSRFDVERSLQQFLKFLQLGIQQPDTAVGKFSLCVEMAHASISHYRTIESAVTQGSVSLYERFYAVVKSNEQLPAFHVNDHTISYGTVDDRARRLCYYMHQQMNVQSGSRILILTTDLYWTTVGILATIALQGTFVLLDECTSDDRDQILRSCGAALMVFDSDVPVDGTIPLIDLRDENIYRYGISDIPAARDLFEPALEIYASAEEHKVFSVDAFIQAVADGEDIFVAANPGTILLGSGWRTKILWPLFSCLFSAKSVITTRKGESVLDRKIVARYIAEEPVNVIYTTPWVLHNFLAAHHKTLVESKVTHILVFADSPWPAALMKSIRSYLRDNTIEIISVYVHADYFGPIAVGTIDKSADDPISIGTILARVKLNTVNSLGSMLSSGVKGAICVTGPGIAIGNANTEPLNTGCFGYQTWDDQIYIESIVGESLWINGRKIDLEKINRAVLRCEGIRGAFTSTLQGKRDKLVTYWHGADADESAIAKYLEQTLPPFLVPDKLKRVSELVVDENGNISRLQENKSAPEGEPIDETRSALFALWADALKTTAFNIHDNFFELGMHSLQAIRIVSRIQKELLLPVEVKDVFAHPSIEKLATFIGTQALKGREYIPRTKPSEQYPLSGAQKRIWIMNQLERNKGGVYNISSAFVLQGSLHAEALQEAFASVVERHDIIRTAFVVIDGEPFQRVRPVGYFDFKIQFHDLSAEKNPTALIDKLLTDESRRPFDLDSDLLLQVTLFRIASQHHIILLKTHHLISDAWSAEVFVRDLSAFYAHHSNHVNPVPAPLHFQYHDFATWHNQKITGDRLEESRQYWKARFADTVPVIPFFGDKHRPPLRTLNGKMTQIRLDSSLVNEIQSISRAHGTTPFVLMLAAVKAILFRYTGATDIVIGIPVLGRDYPDLEEQLGVYVNMLALRTSFHSSDTLASILTRVKKTVRDGFLHQDYPFDQLVKEIAVERDPARSLMYDIIFSWYDENHTQWNFGDQTSEVKVSRYRIQEDVSICDMVFQGGTDGEGIFLNVTYNTDVFSDAFVNRFLDNFRIMLDNMVSRTDAEVRFVTVISDMEMNWLLEKRSTEWIKLKAIAIHEEFKKQVQRTPDAVAVSFDGNEISYQELDSASDCLARILLTHHHVEREELVGIYMGKSEWVVIAMLAVLKAGGAYMPLDNKLPAERIRKLVAHAGLRLIITESQLSAALSEFFAGEIIVAGSKALQFIDRFMEDEFPEVSSHALAYMMYTSGSTGEPKGVLIEHKSVLRLVAGASYSEIEAHTKLLQTGSLSFDAATFEIWVTLLYGGTVYMINEEAFADTSLLTSQIAELNIEVMWLGVALFNHLVDSNLDTFKALKCIIVGGDKLSCHHINQVRKVNPLLKIINGYGPTENTTFSLIHPVNTTYNVSIPIGNPIANSTVYVMDTEMNLLPRGAAGEIYVGGDGVARGYWKLPSLTSERFVNNPHVAHERLYRTGDLGRWNANGEIEFIGRSDNQIKIRGYRVELDEVAQVIREFPAVSEVVVVVKGNTENHKSLVAYVRGTNIDRNQLLQHCSRYLPGYMVPSYFIPVTKFSLNHHGKIDLRELPEPGHALSDQTLPRNEIEQGVADVFKAVLRVQSIGIYDNFFLCGGDSIKAMQISAGLQKTFGLKIGIREIFENPFVESIASQIQHSNLQKIQATGSERVEIVI